MTVRRFSGFTAAAALAILLHMLFGLVVGTASAQSSSPSAARNAAGVTQETAREGDQASQVIATIKSEFATLKLASYLAGAVAVAAGLGVFLFRRRRLMTFSKTSGAVTVGILSLVLLALLSSVLSSSEGAACASAVLEVGAKATDYDDVCRAAREAAANGFGFASGFRAMFIAAGSGYIVPIGTGVLKFLTYFSVLLVALIAFFVVQPLAERLFVRT